MSKYPDFRESPAEDLNDRAFWTKTGILKYFNRESVRYCRDDRIFYIIRVSNDDINVKREVPGTVCVLGSELDRSQGEGVIIVAVRDTIATAMRHATDVFLARQSPQYSIRILLERSKKASTRTTTTTHTTGYR